MERRAALPGLKRKKMIVGDIRCPILYYNNNHKTPSIHQRNFSLVCVTNFSVRKGFSFDKYNDAFLEIDMARNTGGIEMDDDLSEKDVCIGRLTHTVARLESEIFSLQERNRFLLDAFSEMVFIVDNSEKFVFVNMAAAEILGKSPADLLGKTFYDCFPPDVAHHHSTRIRQVFQTARIISDDPPFLLPPKNLWMEGRLIPMMDRDGTVASVVGIIRDVTERKLVENALKESEALFRQIVQQMPYPVLICSPEGIVTIVNSAFLDMFKIPTENEIVGKMDLLKTPFTSEPGTIDEIKKAFSGATVIIPDVMIFPDHAKGAFRGAENSGLSVEITVFPVYLLPGDIFQVVAIILDLTEKKRMEEEMRKSEHLESLGLLAGGIAHDFNNLLSGIFGYVGLAQEYARDNRELKDCLSKAMEVFGQAKSLTQQLFTFSRGGSPVRKIASIAELLSNLTSSAPLDPKVRRTLVLQPDLWVCEADVGLVSEAINSILINAQQTMPDGGEVTVSAENFIVADNGKPGLIKGNYVKISVHNCGAYIPRQQLSKIFDPFFTTKQKGGGLGLAIAYSIIKKHNGHIEIASEPDRGTSVSVYLPAAGPAASKAAAEKTGVVSKTNGRILIMDDEGFVLDAMSGVLKSFGYTVASAKDGAQAIKEYLDARVAGQPFDAVILDLTIQGGFGGKHVLSELRELDPDVSAVATSGFSDDPVMAYPEEFGFKAAICKPYTIEELGRILSGVINGK
jgi:two-component system cell cycle sensor histidine kinase/response regulator CckA